MFCMNLFGCKQKQHTIVAYLLVVFLTRLYVQKLLHVSTVASVINLSLIVDRHN